MTEAGRRLSDPPAERPAPQRIGSRMSFRARLTLGLVAGSVLPLLVFGTVLIWTEILRTGQIDSTLVRVVLFVFAAAIIVTVLFAYLLALVVRVRHGLPDAFALRAPHRGSSDRVRR